LATTYLPQLDALVLDQIKDDLKLCQSVSITCDGWKSRNRRDYISISASYMTTKDNRWQVKVTNLDLVYVPGSCDANNLETLVLGSLHEIVLFSFILCSYPSSN
jgi:hypothetical protein